MSGIEPRALLVADLETTGLDIDDDDIIEFAGILTTLHLDELSRFETLVQPTVHGMTRLNSNTYVREMHTTNGLLTDLAALIPRTLEHTPFWVAQRIVDWLEAQGFYPGEVVLAGSGVSHFDQPKIRRDMRPLADFLAYYTVDVGGMRRTFRWWTGDDLTSVNEDKTHRAMDDAECHVSELRQFRHLFRDGKVI